MNINDLGNHLAKIAPNLIRIRRDIHKHPELGYKEYRTASLVLRELQPLGLELQTGVVDTGIVGVIEGAQPGPTILIRADMDALPIQELNADIDYKSENPGVMHACGHDAHTAILIGTLQILNQMRDKIRGQVKFLFQPAEEEARSRPGDQNPVSAATQVIEAGVLDDVSGVLALHLWPELTVGKVGMKHGPAMGGSCWFRIVLRGLSSHAAVPHKGRDAITAAANLINLLQLVVTRHIDPTEPVLLNIGTIQGGYRRNVVADMVEMTGTVRGLDQHLIEEVFKKRIRETVDGLCRSLGLDFSYDYYSEVPVLQNSTEFLESVHRRMLSEDSLEPVLVDEITLTGEDFAFYTQKLPGLFLYLGSRNPETTDYFPLHSPHFNFDERAIEKGVIAMVNATLAVLDSLH